MGNNTLDNNTTGSYNVALGNQALGANTTASYNSALGHLALNANTTGVSNVAVGYGALASNTTANSNTAMGVNALTANTTGAENVALGQQALDNNTTANNNTALGYQAGYTNTTGGNNVFLGRQSGYSLTTGTHNVLLGHQSGYNVTTGSKNVVLGNHNGNQGGLDIRTTNNSIVLSDGDGNPQLYIKGDTGATKFSGDGRSDNSNVGGVVSMAGRTSNIGGAVSSTRIWHKIFHRSYTQNSAFGHACLRIEVVSNGATNGDYQYGNILISTKQQGTGDYHVIQLMEGTHNMFNNVAWQYSSSGGTDSGGSLSVYFKPFSYSHTELMVNVNRDYYQDTGNGYAQWTSLGSSSQPSGSTLLTAVTASS